ncbi:uncharacterized protein LAESUDRAFT_724039 [Laetiporus sulphureus 93-53]|uniref:Uncharacterized protein n=1 Tax=Laetiporus sulphureus 93-53 TaxID=1314785 RepID=A0A165EZM8_9APHY|nr:uncharacterized protein LAESUDRAFT_724039 [Laetiporus sulphureus 93-53]KZT08054.1 hypothetical protein LAESUDRAFT_724039 [Laetiporus sulphureus 93-53]
MEASHLRSRVHPLCKRQPTHDSRQDESHFSKRCASSGALSRLRSITLSVQEQQPGNWEGDVTLFLLAPASPEHFHISTVGGLVAPALDELLHGNHGRARAAPPPLLHASHAHEPPVSSTADICQLCHVVEQTTLIGTDLCTLTHGSC